MPRIRFVFLFVALSFSTQPAFSGDIHLAGLITCFHDGNKNQETPAKNILAIPYQFANTMAISDEFGNYVLTDIPKSLVDRNIYIGYRDTEKFHKYKHFFIAAENLETADKNLRYRLPRSVLEMNCDDLKNDPVGVQAFKEGYLRQVAANKAKNKAFEYLPMMLTPIPILGGMDLLEQNKEVPCSVCNVGILLENNGLAKHDLYRLFLFSNNIGFNLTSSRELGQNLSQTTRKRYRHAYLSFYRMNLDDKTGRTTAVSAENSSLMFNYRDWSFKTAYQYIWERNNKSSEYSFDIAKQFRLFHLNLSYSQRHLEWKTGFPADYNEIKPSEIDVFVSIYPAPNTQLTFAAINLNNTKLGDDAIPSKMYGVAAKYLRGRVHLGAEVFQQTQDSRLHTGVGIDYKPPIPKTRIVFGAAHFRTVESFLRPEFTANFGLEYYGVKLSYTHSSIIPPFFSLAVNWSY